MYGEQKDFIMEEKKQRITEKRFGLFEKVELGIEKETSIKNPLLANTESPKEQKLFKKIIFNFNQLWDVITVKNRLTGKKGDLKKEIYL